MSDLGHASEPEGSSKPQTGRQTVQASSLGARLDLLGKAEKAALASRSATFARYPADIRHELTEGKNWYIHRGDRVIDGDFDNDLFLVVDGDLTVRGVYNDDRFGTGALLCLGELRAEHVLSWNAFCAAGSLYAAGLVIACYNDLSFEVYGPRLQARALVLQDKSSELPELLLVEVSSNDEGTTGDLERVLAPSMLKYSDEAGDEIDAAKAKELRSAGEEVQVAANGDKDEVFAQVYQGSVFAGPYRFPADPAQASEDELRLALLQRDVPEPVLQAALARPALGYDLGLAPGATPAVLNALADDKSEARVLRAVASNQATAPETQSRLAGNPDERVRAALARNPACAPALAARLAEDTSPLVRHAIAGTPWAARNLERLVADPDKHVRRAITFQPGLGLAQLRVLIADPDPGVRRRARGHLPATLDLVRELAESENPELRAWAAWQAGKLLDQAPGQGQASSPRPEKELLHKLALDPALTVREAAFKTQRLRLGFIEQHSERLGQDESKDIRAATAQVCRRPDVLDRLAQDPEELVRDRVAGNLATPPEVLVEMARRLAEEGEKQSQGGGMSPREQFALFLMKNPLLPAAAFEQIARFWPRYYRLEPHPNMPLGLYLSYHEPARLTRLLDENPSLRLAFMARSSERDLVSMAAMHSLTPPEALAHLQRTLQDPYLLEDLARNAYLGSGTPEAASLIADLLARGNQGVIRALLGNPHLPREVLEREAHHDPATAQEVLWSRHGIELPEKP